MKQTLFPEFPVLVVDDEKNFLNSIYFELRCHGITNVECCQDSCNVMALLKSKRYSVILLDILMPHITGDELLPQIVNAFPELPVIVVTAFADNETATKYLKKGAFDYHTKPIDIKELIHTIQDAWDLRNIHKEIIQSKKELFSGPANHLRSFPNLLTDSQEMQTIYMDIGLIAFTSRPVLILGEPGVGKEFMAREIHKQSLRKGKFLSINTVGLDDEFFTTTLFGYKKGAFAGAYKDTEGLIEEAQGGTLYLNEISVLAIESQSKLLRLLQNREYFPLGASEPKPTNVRIVAASNKNLSVLLQVGAIHLGLYTRLKPHEIYIPPLRERKEDIRLLFIYFLEVIAEKNDITPPSLPAELFPLLEKYDFPGNIDELKHLVAEAVARYNTDMLPLDVFLLRTQKSIDLNIEPLDKAI
jgi:DNA-binding NtrC family response regulator